VGSGEEIMTENVYRETETAKRPHRTDRPRLITGRSTGDINVLE